MSVAAVCVSTAAALWASTTTVTQGAIVAGPLPAAPSNLVPTVAFCSATRTYYTLSFTWKAPNPTTSVRGYAIYSSTASGGPYSTLVGTVSGAGTLAYTTTTQYTDWNTTHYYVVRATSGGSWVSAWSAQVSFRVRTTNCP